MPETSQQTFSFQFALQMKELHPFHTHSSIQEKVEGRRKKEQFSLRKMMLSSTLHPLLLLLLSQLLLIILSHFPEQSRAAQTYQNISLGTTLSTSGTTNWLSPSGDFAFGFTPLPSINATSLFLLAIWFAKTDDKTIVWTANGNTPVPADAKLQLTSDGLSLTDPTNNSIIWTSTTVTSAAASYAAILNTGNLVLMGTTSNDPIWQSFEYPTDTLLPTQVLLGGTQLWSRLTSTNYSDGRFTLTLENNGDLTLRQLAVPITTKQSYDPYWSTSTSDSGSKLIFNPSGSTVYLELTNNTRINITSASLGSNAAADFYLRATLDSDGVFRHYLYPKKTNGGWPPGWSPSAYVPEDICRVLTNDCGSGVCGFNSYCQLDGNQRAVCQCPNNYSFIDSRNEYRGCMPEFAAQRCDVDDSLQFFFMEMVNTDWPLSDYEYYDKVTEDNCRDYCLSDCFCAVAIFRNGECWKKKLPLSNGRFGSYVGGKALIKVSKNDTSSMPPQTLPTLIVKKKDRKGLIIVGSSILGGSVLVNVLFVVGTLFMIFCYPCKRKHLHLQDNSGDLDLGLRRFTYEELHEATDGFSEELGRGAFSTVYKGALKVQSRTCIAVKKLDKVLQDIEKEFMAEVRSIGQTHHKNLVRLLGYCSEGENRLLVYEFMSNGSLTRFLFGDTRPDWNKRMNIIIGVARGLLYLHEECTTPIIHCDIKSQNILLDDCMVAKISDFGLAKLLITDQSRTSTGIRGTRGYVAPEWFKSMPITPKVDVYSFGVMLLELICCRKNLEQASENEEAVVLVYWAYDCYRDRRLDILVASDREAVFDMSRVERFVMVAIWCIQEEPSLRPTMQKVTLMLEGSVAVPVPPDPSSYMSSIR